MTDFTVEELLDNGISFNIVNQYTSEDEQTKLQARQIILSHFMLEILDQFTFDDAINEDIKKIDEALSNNITARFLESKLPAIPHSLFISYCIILKCATSFIEQVILFERRDVKLSYYFMSISEFLDEDFREFSEVFFLTYEDTIEKLKAAGK